jgi:acyl transferase domain-containing protein/phosphopantetheinyl transferase (holo-ACP synthase)
MPTAVDGAEPEQFLALRVAHEALIDAGHPDIPVRTEKTAVILGRGTYANRGLMNLYQHGFLLDELMGVFADVHPEWSMERLSELRGRLEGKLPAFDPHTAPGIVSALLTGRIANRLDLNGGNYTIDAACASSLLAIEHGARELRSGQSDAVIAGGVQVADHGLVMSIFSKLGAISSRGEVRPFDRDADGILIGQGIGMVVLKRLEDAQADGNRVYALIKAVGTSSDGRAKSIVAPRVEGEALALCRAYELAEITPDTVELIEAHGTGIPLGDQTEIEALRRVFGPPEGTAPHCAVGSVKSMIGHLLPAAGIAGLIKAALAIYHKTLPPTLQHDHPNLSCGLEGSRFYVNTRTRPWLHGHASSPRRAGVNAFGFGGINSHAILEDVERAAGEPRSDTRPVTWESELCVIDSEGRAELIERIEMFGRALERTPGADLEDVAFSLHAALTGGSHRLAIVANSAGDLSRKLAYARGKLVDPACTALQDRSGIFYFDEPMAEGGKLAFLFPGEGAQYEYMLSDLCMAYPAVLQCFDETERAFVAEATDRRLSDLVFPVHEGAASKNGEGGLWGLEVGVQAVTTANRALLRLWRQFGVVPDAVMGHSSGEFGALEAAGAIAFAGAQEFNEYVRAGKESARSVSALADALEPVRLLAVGGPDADAIRRVVEEGGDAYQVAMDNCPHQIVVCVGEKVGDTAIDLFHAAGASCSSLPFARPYHTPVFVETRAPLQALFRSLEVRIPEVPVYSCATTTRMPLDASEVRRLAVEQWSLPVRFRETIEAMYEDGIRIFLEVGPRSNLTSFVDDILRDRPHVAAPTNVHHRNDLTQLASTAGLLFAHGCQIKLAELFAGRSPNAMDLEGLAHGNAPPECKELAPRIELGLPSMRLGPRDLAQIAEAPSANDLEAGDRVGNGVRPIPSVGSSASRATGDRHEVMAGYLTMMGEYARSQETLIKRFLEMGGRGPGVGADSHPGTATGPLLGTLVQEAGGGEQVRRRRINRQQEIFLKDHTLAGKVSAIDDDLSGLAVMPFTVSIEMLAEAAAAMAPGSVVIGLRDLRARRWLVLEPESIVLETRARRVAPDRIHVTLSAVCSGGENQEQPAVEGDVLLATSYPQPPSVPDLKLGDARPSRFSPEKMYATGMFTGPCFQAVKSIRMWSPAGVIGSLQVSRRDGLFVTDKHPSLAMDPVVLDGVGQLLAHWNAEGHSSGFNVFPYRLDEVDLYGGCLDSGAVLEGRLSVQRLSDLQIRGEVSVLTPAGQLYMQVRGWESRTFDLPETFYGMLHGKPDLVLGTEWTALQRCAPPHVRCAVRKVGGFSRELLLGSGQIWLKVLAHQVLSRKERQSWDALDDDDDLRMRWLLERAASKDAVRSLMNTGRGAEICLADIEIGSDGKGNPVVVNSSGAGMDLAPVLSVAYADGVAAAVALDPSAGFRPGLELSAIMDPGGVTDAEAFSESELKALEAVTCGSYFEMRVRLDCARAAIAKAAPLAQEDEGRRIIVRELDQSTGAVVATGGNESKGPAVEALSTPWTAFTLMEEGLIGGIAFLK